MFQVALTVFSFSFSQESSHDSGLYNDMNTHTHQQCYTNRGQSKLQSKSSMQSLGKCQDEWPHREYGFIPDRVLRCELLPIAPELELKNDQQWLEQMHINVVKYELQNYKGARIPVSSTLHISYVEMYILKDYDLPIVGDYLQFGFPINFDFKIFQSNTGVINHKSALQRERGVNKYFTTEVNKGYMLGPVKDIPFEKLHYSPLIARDKTDGDVRVIVHLSWPLCKSINSYIPDKQFDEMKFILQYPTIDMVIDLERAFRNLVDPSAYSLLCLNWNDVTYVDDSIAFGLKIGVAACQMCTNYISRELGL